MKRSGLTTRTLAEQTTLSEGTLKSWLAGAAPRALEDVRILDQFFNVSFEYLIFGDELSLQKKSKDSAGGHVFEGWLKVKIESLISTSDID